MSREGARSTATRRRLRDAAIELVVERGYQAVTVEEIAERAGVTRATFYRHHRDKDRLLADAVDEISDTVLERAAGATTHPLDLDGIRLRLLFEHARHERELFRLILRGEADGLPLRTLTERVIDVARVSHAARVARTGHQPRVDPELLARMAAGEVLAVLGWWLELDPAPDATTVVDQLRATSSRGRIWAGGGDPAHVPVTDRSVTDLEEPA
ncbi:MAG TPA: TetR/AcrR family transcriptional regulator [Acidimicrobiales bacterium]|nr:TetR/AcrR family transcriptional regulator [Acidimicrobiales bacterium]